VYVPESLADRVTVIDPRTYRVVRRFAVGREPQHVVPSWDLRTLWVNDDLGNDLVPIDPRTGRRGPAVPVADPYNLYFSPDGRHALVMAERLRRIDVRDPHTMRLQRSLRVPCRGVNHADFTADGSTMLASCEFSGRLLVIPTSFRRVAAVVNLNRIRTPGTPSRSSIRAMSGPVGSLAAGASSMPQDVRLTADGRSFVVADMLRGGVWVVDAARHRVTGFVRTGAGAHGIYPSRDGRALYVTNRDGASVSVLDATGRRVRALWRLPRGSSPDMGGVSLDGRRLWLSGRYDSEVYVLSTRSGRLVRRIPVGPGPHGLAVWPQPGRHSLGHTGNMR
jgi:DNA-binding beta-propeller fold protein YncE